MKCEHKEAEIVSSTGWSPNPVFWCQSCGAIGETESLGEPVWRVPTSQSGICPCGGYKVRAYDAALDSYRLVCEECGR